MRRLLLPACLALLATAPAAFAEDCDRNDDSQSMLNICADADCQAADAKLNAAYKNIVSSNDQASNKLLQTAQRAWIAFRDAECAYSTADSEGGSIHPMEVSQCLTKLTNERIKQLTSGANCKLSDPSCAGSEGDDDQGIQ
ncbi:lysozyme inhibitor LprI family protein [Mesorhizobium sp. CA16]|uniref:lysozyme inhibitor LprI family protein n=1 Tax=Mesorhizobium sp. CA16 TaxID=588496 RepID=UPI001CC9D3A0|nr:lysozyme inhibitor LprI family protein [Mesorhizobium sp. CA16]MBZ9913951.1 lysozyme inhibitor LprI family protein [Mesorhizobium sp. CA16]